MVCAGNPETQVLASLAGLAITVAATADNLAQFEQRRAEFEAKANQVLTGAEARKATLEGRKRRYVLYKGYAEPSRVPVDWHGWLHHTLDTPPTKMPLDRREWDLDHTPNMTGTPYATYFEGAQFVHFLLGPATVALALPLWDNLGHVRRAAHRLFGPAAFADLARQRGHRGVQRTWLALGLPGRLLTPG